MGEDMGYDPANETQYRHVLNNLSSPSMRRQAQAWVEGNMLTMQKRKEVANALGEK